MLEPLISEFGGESEADCAPLTESQLAARDAAWPEYGSHPIMSRDQARNMAEGRFFHGELETPVPTCLGESVKIRFDLAGWPVQRDPCSCGSLAGDIRAKLAVAASVVTAGRYGLHLCAPDALSEFMAECRAFLAELGRKMNCETFALPERASIPMVEIPEVLRRAWAEHCGVDDLLDWNPSDLSRLDRDRFDLFRAGWDAAINRVGD